MTPPPPEHVVTLPSGKAARVLLVGATLEAGDVGDAASAAAPDAFGEAVELVPVLDARGAEAAELELVGDEETGSGPVDALLGADVT